MSFTSRAMAQSSRVRGHDRRPQPQSMESLYKTTQNFCNSIQKALDAVGQQCLRLYNNKDNEHIIEVLERLNVLHGDLQLYALSDVQCQLLIEDLDLDISEGALLGLVKKLRDLELLRKSAADTFLTLNKRLSLMLDNGIYVFCVSLIELTQGNVNEVTEYNDFTSEQRSNLIQTVNQIEQHQERWINLTMDTQSVLSNLEELVACFENIQGVWNKIREGVAEWINHDREYAICLTNCIRQQGEVVKILLREIDAISEKEQQKMEERRCRRLRMEALQKRRRDLCNTLKLIQRAKRFNASKMAAFDSDSAQIENNGGECSSAKPSTTGDDVNVSDDSKAMKEFYRRRDAKLDKEESDIKSSLTNVIKRISDLKCTGDEDEKESGANTRRIGEIKAEIAQNQRIQTDCREILLQRGKVQTFLQLRRGVIVATSRGKTPFEEACKFVALRVRHEWPRLYLHLPMWPTRSLSQRQDDIITLSGFERMNVVLPRNRTPVDDATAALEKWRLLSRHYVDVEGLVTGLTLAGWSAWAKEVLIRFGQDVGLATKSEKVTFDVKEAGDASAEERMNLEIEMKENLSADKELLRQSTNENDTSVKSPHDEISETVHQNWSQESIRSELICESSVDDFDKQSSLNAIGNQCHGEPGFSPIQEGSVLEASSTEQNVLSEEGNSKNSSLPSSRPGSIVKEAETEQHNSSNDVSDNSSHNSLKQDELVDKSDHFSEEDEIIDSSPTHFSCKTSLSNDTSTKRNDCSRQISRYIGQKDSKSTRHIRSAKPCNRGESSKTTTKASISDYKLQNSHDKSSTCAIHGAWKSHENFKVKSVGSEGDEETNSQKQKLESDRGEMEECPAQKPMTSKRAASVNTSESMKDEHHSDRTLSFEMDNYCFCTEAKKNKIKQDALVVRRDTVEPKSESSKNENLKGSSNEEEDEHGSDKIMKFDADASLAKVKDEDSTCQCEIPTSQGEDAMSNDDCSIRPSPLQYDNNEKGIGESRSKEDEPVEKLVENIIKSSPKSELLMTGRRTSKIQKNNHLSKGNKKSHKVFHEKTKGDNEANKVELTKAAKRGGCGSTKSASFREEESPKDSNIPNEIENQIIRISIESENSGKTPSISSSKKKSKDEKSRGKKNRGANEKK